MKLHLRESNSGHVEKAVMWILKFRQRKSALFSKNSSRVKQLHIHTSSNSVTFRCTDFDLENSVRK